MSSVCPRVCLCVPCVSRLPRCLFTGMRGFGRGFGRRREVVRECRWVWMVVRFVCVIPVRPCAVSRVCVPCRVCVPAPPGVFYRIPVDMTFLPAQSVRFRLRSRTFGAQSTVSHTDTRREKASPMPPHRARARTRPASTSHSRQRPCGVSPLSAVATSRLAVFPLPPTSRSSPVRSPDRDSDCTHTLHARCSLLDVDDAPWMPQTGLSFSRAVGRPSLCPHWLSSTCAPHTPPQSSISI